MTKARTSKARRAALHFRPSANLLAMPPKRLLEIGLKLLVLNLKSSSAVFRHLLHPGPERVSELVKVEKETVEVKG